MAGYEQARNCGDGYSYVARIKVSYGYDSLNKERRPQSYSVRPGEGFSFKFAKMVFKKLIEQINDFVLVKLQVTESNEIFTYGSSNVQFNLKKISEIYDIYIFTEDIEKIDTEPVRITCLAESYPDEKEDFIKILKAVLR